MKLSGAQVKVLLALVQEQQEAAAAVDEFVRFVGRDFQRPIIRQTAEGFFVQESESEE